MNAAEKQDLFESSNVTEAIVRMALPTVVGQIILLLYNMADTFFVGLTGKDAMLTAVTVCMPAFMFLSAISNLFGVGGAGVIARSLGKRDPDRARAASGFAFWGCLASAGLYSLPAWVFRHGFVDLLGGPFSASAYTYISFFQAVGEGRKSFLLAILRKGIVDIPMMFLLGALAAVYGIVAATPLADILCCLTAHVIFTAYLRKLGYTRSTFASIKDLVRRGFGVSVLARSACPDEQRKKKPALLTIENRSMARGPTSSAARISNTRS